jgi:hypothetical protein
LRRLYKSGRTAARALMRARSTTSRTRQAAPITTAAMRRSRS